MYKTILFDLDGTLTDPGIGITNSVMYALSRYGITVAKRSELYRFIGPPLYDSFRGFYGFSHEDAEAAVALYREYFSDKGLYENEVYEGVPIMLSRLKKSDKKLVVATSKPEPYALKILDHFGLSSYFDHICGATFDASRNRKSDVIAYALNTAGVTDTVSVIMVGDREHDINGARDNGIASVGVLYGYGSRDELVAAGADHIAATPYDIPLFL